MDDSMIRALMSNLENDLISQELDQFMHDVDIDVDIILRKAQSKLKKERKKMNKNRKRAIASLAASLFLVCGAITVHATEISTFLQRIMGKSEVYGTVVDGQTYYLEHPVDLGNGEQLTHALFERGELQLRLTLTDGKYSDVKIRIDGTEMEPTGREGSTIFFSKVNPTNQFDLVLNSQSYLIQLASSKPIVIGDDIVEAKAGNVLGISIGYKDIPGGIQLLASVEDPSINILNFGTPSSDIVKQQYGRLDDFNSVHTEFAPMVGYDEDGNSYELHSDSSDLGRPLTNYMFDVPTGKTLAVTLPSIVVTTEKTFEIKVSLPSNNRKHDVLQTIDLGLQSIQLMSVERTSDRTAQLRFTLNTDDQNDVRIWEGYFEGAPIDSMDALWENGTCILDVTFPSKTSELMLSVAKPVFIVDGNWTLCIK